MRAHFLILLLMAANYGTSQQHDWKLQKEADGIQIYTRHVEGEVMNETKGVAIMNATVSSAIAVLLDVDHFHEWSPGAKFAHLLEKRSPTELVYYVETAAPWPLSNRDGIYTMSIGQEPSGLVSIETGCLPDFIPEKKGLVRIPKSSGSWLIKPLSPTQIEVTYRNLADPGGSIPEWVANSGSVSIPFKMLKKMAEQVQQPKYIDRSFSFLKSSG